MAEWAPSACRNGPGRQWRKRAKGSTCARKRPRATRRTRVLRGARARTGLHEPLVDARALARADPGRATARSRGPRSCDRTIARWLWHSELGLGDEAFRAAVARGSFCSAPSLEKAVLVERMDGVWIWTLPPRAGRGVVGRGARVRGPCFAPSRARSGCESTDQLHQRCTISRCGKKLVTCVLNELNNQNGTEECICERNKQHLRYQYEI